MMIQVIIKQEKFLIICFKPKYRNTGINVHQTDAASESVYNGRGFDSGAKTQSGNFRETFLAAGTYFYSSDSVWNIPLFMAGRVIVEADSTDMDLEVKVNLTDVEAFHDLATGTLNLALL